MRNSYYKNTDVSSKSPTIRDLEWAAGFLEGEGSFGGWNNKTVIQAAQKAANADPIWRLHTLFGGGLIESESTNKKWNDHVRWSVTGARARGIMLTLYPLLSPYLREKIRCVLNPSPKEHLQKQAQ